MTVKSGAMGAVFLAAVALVALTVLLVPGGKGTSVFTSAAVAATPAPADIPLGAFADATCVSCHTGAVPAAASSRHPITFDHMAAATTCAACHQASEGTVTLAMSFKPSMAATAH